MGRIPMKPGGSQLFQASGDAARPQGRFRLDGHSQTGREGAGLKRTDPPSGVFRRLKKQGSLYRPSGPEGIRETTFRAFRAVGA
jgi:hypothetical protein